MFYTIDCASFFVSSCFSFPEPKSNVSYHNGWMSVVKNCFKGHLLNYWLDFYQILKESIIVKYLKSVVVGHPEPEKKLLLAFLSTFWHPCSKCILMCFKKDRGGCQVWKCPKVPELGQRSTERKFLYIRQILAFLSISYPKL